MYRPKYTGYQTYEFSSLKSQVIQTIGESTNKTKWELTLEDINPNARLEIVAFLQENGFEASVTKCSNHREPSVLTFNLAASTLDSITDPRLKELFSITTQDSNIESIESLLAKQMLNQITTSRWNIAIQDLKPEVVDRAISFLQKNGFKVDKIGFYPNRQLEWAVASYTEKQIKDPILQDIMKKRNALLGSESATSRKREVEPTRDGPNTTSNKARAYGFFDKKPLVQPSIHEANSSPKQKLLAKALSSINMKANDKDKIDAVRDFIFRQIWLDSILSKFSFSTVKLDCYISYHRYHNDGNIQTPSIILAQKLVDDLELCKPLIVTNGSRSVRYQDIFQKIDEGAAKVHKAGAIICVMSENEASDNYYQPELRVVSTYSWNKLVIPIAINSSLDKCLPIYLQHLEGFAYQSSNRELAYCLLFAELIGQLGLLDNETLKAEFIKQTTELQDKIGRDYSDADILTAIKDRGQQDQDVLRSILDL